ncbi:unnamed protein product, partial [Oppiella nova]
MAVLMRSVVRWHTLRVMLLTSMVWLIVGICLLVYYMECLAHNAFNCNTNSQLSDNNAKSNLRFSDESNDYLNDNSVHDFVANQRADNSFLPHYKPIQLKPWTPRVLKSNPSHWLGENGKAVIIGKDEEELKNEKFNLNKFNLLASDRIALNRSLPDVRMDGCRRKHHPKLLPSTSIVIVFHNEAWSTLLRTVHSIIRTSPEALIEEILLVDDASERVISIAILQDIKTSRHKTFATQTTTDSMSAVLMRSVVRWHTLRVMLLTSMVWLIVGICLLVYYMECLAHNAFNCNTNSQLSDNNAKSNLRFSDESNDYLNDNSVHDFVANQRADNSFLPHYKPIQLKPWTPRVLKSNPSHWLGENGKAVIIGKDEEELKNEKFNLNKFNLLASDRIALNRSLPDVRMDGCRRKHHPKLLPSTSIVIVFHNEAWSTLLRTVHSIIRTSPEALIEEILLVDDASERDFLGKELEEYVSKLSVSVRVLRTGKRSGLIRARLIGAKEAKGQVITFLDAHCECAKEAKGQVITFLDAHCECTKGWLEPLLSRIVEDRTRVVCPIIDVISDENFEYIPASDMTWGGFNWKLNFRWYTKGGNGMLYIPASDMTWGGFNWKLNFRWYRVPQRELDRRKNDRTLPVRTPTMAGGLFSMDKQYFESLGKYDEGMDIWGGENLELSFRIWMCGGTLEIVTCSHVGHVFRKSTPYTFPGGTSKIVNHNNARLADVWLDEWKDFYYAINPLAKKTEMGDTESRKQLRRDLQCKSFRWYLENIYPESSMPLDYYSLGDIKNIENNNCLDTYGRKSGENL